MIVATNILNEKLMLKFGKVFKNDSKALIDYIHKLIKSLGHLEYAETIKYIELYIENYLIEE